MEKLVKTLGVEKKLDLVKDFDLINDKYRKIANEKGYKGKLKFLKKGGFITILVEIED